MLCYRRNLRTTRDKATCYIEQGFGLEKGYHKILVKAVNDATEAILSKSLTEYVELHKWYPHFVNVKNTAFAIEIFNIPKTKKKAHK